MNYILYILLNNTKCIFLSRKERDLSSHYDKWLHTKWLPSLFLSPSFPLSLSKLGVSVIAKHEKTFVFQGHTNPPALGIWRYRWVCGKKGFFNAESSLCAFRNPRSLNENMTFRASQEIHDFKCHISHQWTNPFENTIFPPQFLEKSQKVSQLLIRQCNLV